VPETVKPDRATRPQREYSGWILPAVVADMMAVAGFGLAIAAS
jgi:hypothetical protein